MTQAVGGTSAVKQPTQWVYGLLFVLSFLALTGWITFTIRVFCR